MKKDKTEKQNKKNIYKPRAILAKIQFASINAGKLT